jgi:hypothetical protein
MPYQPPGRRAVTPGGQGRFPGFDVLEEVRRWDDVTSGAVLARLDPSPDLSFFTPSEQACASALLDQLLAQREEPKVPVLALIDHRLALDETDGWRYEDMPDDPVAWRLSLAALDADAQDKTGRLFCQLDWDGQAQLVQAVHDTDGKWHDWPASHVWSLWTRYACAAFYSHPWAWNEMGFGGPAYPRGYKSLGIDQRERWEVADHGGDPDGGDPVGWADRRERALREHARATGIEPQDQS